MQIFKFGATYALRVECDNSKIFKQLFAIREQYNSACKPFNCKQPNTGKKIHPKKSETESNYIQDPANRQFFIQKNPQKKVIACQTPHLTS